jgi:hypothetical protein
VLHFSHGQGREHRARHAAIASAQSLLRFLSHVEGDELAELLHAAACRALRIDPAAGVARPVAVDTA